MAYAELTPEQKAQYWNLAGSVVTANWSTAEVALTNAALSTTDTVLARKIHFG